MVLALEQWRRLNTFLPFSPPWRRDGPQNRMCLVCRAPHTPALRHTAAAAAPARAESLKKAPATALLPAAARRRRRRRSCTTAIYGSLVIQVLPAWTSSLLLLLLLHKGGGRAFSCMDKKGGTRLGGQNTTKGWVTRSQTKKRPQMGEPALVHHRQGNQSVRSHPSIVIRPPLLLASPSAITQSQNSTR